MPESFRVCRDHVGHLGCIQESTMNPLIRKQLLPQHCYIIIGGDQRVQGVDSLPRVTACMGIATRKFACAGILLANVNLGNINLEVEALTVNVLSGVHKRSSNSAALLPRVQFFGSRVTSIRSVSPGQSNKNMSAHAISEISTPLYAPASISFALPPPFSSAGVPNNCVRP